jgi:predicted dehydrogenase
MKSNVLDVALIGCGYWGKNLLRNLIASPDFNLLYVVEPNIDLQNQLKNNHPNLEFLDSIHELSLDKISAAFIATPAATHPDLAIFFLEHNIHVWVEKPLALTLKDSNKIISMAKKNMCQVFVDHTFIFHSSVKKIKQILDEGTLGKVFYVDSLRQNFGIIQKDAGVTWDLAVHDFAIYAFLFGTPSGSISAREMRPIAQMPSVAAVINFQSKVGPTLQVNVNWLSPEKLRKFALIGSQKSLVYDDINQIEPLRIYERSLSNFNLETNKLELSNFRFGDIFSPNFERTEALATALSEFAMCIGSGESERQLAITEWVMKCLEASSISAASGGVPVEVKNE